MLNYNARNVTQESTTVWLEAVLNQRAGLWCWHILRGMDKQYAKCDGKIQR